MINTHDQPHFIWRDQKCFSRPISLPIVGYPHCRERPVSPVVWGVHSRQAQGSNASPTLAGFCFITELPGKPTKYLFIWLWHVGSSSLTRDRTRALLQHECKDPAFGPPGKPVDRGAWTVLWSIGSQRIEHNLATKRQLEFTFIIKDYSILRYYLDHLQFQANQFEGLFFSFFADNIQANFQPHGYNPSGALPKQKPLELLQSTAPACGQVIQSGPSEIWRTEHGSRTDNFLSAKPKSRRDLT